MTKTLLVISAAGLLIVFAWAARVSPARPTSHSSRSMSPVVIELFTSEGCSSCPPADKLLAQLEQEKNVDGVPVIVLGEHVDYWNGLGWTDRFSSRGFTNRQKDYAQRLKVSSVYTPQMVVDGQFEFVGNDEPSLHREVELAARSTKQAELKLAWRSPSVLQVDVSKATKPDAAVLLAITESALSTTVDAGENGGRVLRHAGVVRKLQQLGPVRNGSYSRSVPIQLDPAWNKSKLTVIVLVQDGSDGPILGAASTAVQ